jgi:hypothetical protein
MAFVIDGINATFRGIAELILKEKNTAGKLLVLPKPTNFALLENPQQKRLPSTDSTGHAVFQGAFKAGYDWQMQCGFANLQPEILQLRLARKFGVKASQILTVARSIYVDKNAISAAADSDTIGHGVVADVVANASYKDGHTSVKLNQVDFADLTTDLALATPLLTESFAIGINAALLFSDDVVGKFVSITFPVTVTNALVQSADVLPRYEVDITLVTTDNEAVYVKVYDAQVNIEGAGFVPGSDAIDVPFFVIPVPGRGLPYDFTFTGKKVLVS